VLVCLANPRSSVVSSYDPGSTLAMV
jgi:hypothetical protein